ncbi:MAG: branched-chain amino acid ABC transporter permease [Deltaproteobacteria bacterium]|nr:branched-chain amino acid ABC transporter permease [Deltaproteobacteria bacterium]
MNCDKYKNGNIAMSLLLKYGAWIGAAIIAFGLPAIVRSSYGLSLLSQVGIAIIFALSYNMLLGQGGMLSFGHAVFYGLGGFLTIHVINIINGGSLPIPLELVPLAGGFGALLFGIVFGWISTKRAGTTFALISLGIGELIASSALMLPSFFGGEEGISGDRMLETTLTWFEFAQQIDVYYLIAFRTIQYALSSLFAGVAGGLFAINYEILTAETIGAIESGNVLMMTYIGGVGHFFGPILGAVLVTFMQISLSNITHAWPLYFGLLFMGMVLWAPNGLAGIIMVHEPVWKAKLMKKLLPGYALAAIPALVLFLGVMILIEINYHLSLSINPDAPMHMFGIEFDARAPVAWGISIVLIVVGFVFLRRTVKTLNRSWQEITQIMKKGAD